MFWHCFLKTQTRWRHDVRHTATLVTEASHSNNFHRPWLPDRGISHWCSPVSTRRPSYRRIVRRQRFAPMLSFFVAAVGHSVNFSV